MTVEDFREIGAIRAQSPKFAAKWEQAVDLCSGLLRESQNPYVSISGGKDSGVRARAVTEAARRTGATFRCGTQLSDAAFPGTEETVRAIVGMTGMPLDIFKSPVSAFDYLAENDARRQFGKSGVFYESIREYARDKDLSFVGVRASESKRRRKAANVNGQVFRSVSMGDVLVCYPILWFTLEDIAAATEAYNIPLHPIYDKQAISCKNSQG